ncbi:hypothetical protein D9619_009972 [Psilocybe cf. subviscida]|uniref:GST N-terminal domain-containing protein n=1 Tax=Psilocybe cf. subviscida TaxID=2480587 RepID=A0A8H5F6P3_9AGAR|nr:hypothetical protein D9619_009972 [Psilocybe cf. subviscida]
MKDQPAYTVIGSPLPTFTRTVTLGLLHKGIQYTHIATPPHNCVAFSAHPFGYLPALIIHAKSEDEEDTKLCECQAIVRYIDRVASEPSLHLIPPGKVVALKARKCGRVPIIERGVVKHRLRAEGNLTEEQICAQLEDGRVCELQRYLEGTETLMTPDRYVLGDRLTWADYFFYPLMADRENGS